MNPLQSVNMDDDVISAMSGRLEDALKAALRGVFEVAMGIAVDEISSLINQALYDVRGQIEETKKENISLKLRLQQIHPEPYNQKQINDDPNQNFNISTVTSAQTHENSEKRFEPSDQEDPLLFQNRFAQLICVNNVKSEPEEPALDRNFGSGCHVRPDYSLHQRSNEEIGLDQTDEKPSFGTLEVTLPSNVSASPSSTQFDGLYQSSDKNFTQPLLNFRDQVRTDPVQYVCHLCVHAFQSENDLCDHDIQCHKTVVGGPKKKASWKRNRNGPPISSLYNCATCNMYFSCQQSFRAHMQKHNDVHSYSCVICGRRFCQLEELIRHFRIHLRRKPFICLVCGNRFKKRKGLQFHQIVHSLPRDTAANDAAEGGEMLNV